MAAGNIHLLIFILSLNPPTLFGNIQINPKERSDTLQSDLDFDLEEGLLESEHKDETKKILADSLVLQQPGLEELEFDPGPFQLLPAKRKYHEMIAADLFFNLLTKFALYMILASLVVPMVIPMLELLLHLATIITLILW